MSDIDKISSLADVPAILKEFQAIESGLRSILDTMAVVAKGLAAAGYKTDQAEGIKAVIELYNQEQKAAKDAAAAIKLEADEKRKAANAEGKLTESQKERITNEQALLKLKKDYISQLKTEQAAGAEKVYTSLRTELRNVRQELATLIAAGKGIDNPEVSRLASRMDTLKDAMTKANNMAELMDTPGKFVAFTKAVTGVAAAFEVARGASALFGKENEDLQKVMVKIQAIIAVTHGLQTLTNNLRKESVVWTLAENTGIKIKNGLLGWYNYLTGQSAASKLSEAAATTTQAAAQETLNAAQKKSGGYAAILIAAIALAAKGAYDASTETKKLTKSIEAYDSAVKEAAEDETWNNSIKETIKNITKLKLEYQVLTGVITQDEADKQTVINDAQEKTQSSFNEYYTNKLKITTAYNAQELEAQKLYNKQLSQGAGYGADNAAVMRESFNKEKVKREEKYNQDLLDLQAKYNSSYYNIQQEADLKTVVDQQETDNKLLEDQEKAYEKQLASTEKYNEEIENLFKKHRDAETEIMEDGIAKDKKLLQDQYDDEIATIEALEITAEDKLKAKAEATEIYNARILAVDVKYNNLKIKADLAYYAASIENQTKLLKAKESQYDKDIAEFESAIKLKHALDETDTMASKELIDLRIEANENRYKQGIIDEQTYNTRKNELETEAAKNTISIDKETADAITKNRDQLYQSMKTISDAIFEIERNNRQYNLDDEIEKLEAAKEAELSVLTLTEEEKIAINAKYDELKRKEMHKDWDKQQEAAVIQATIQGVLAVLKALATEGPWGALAAGIEATAATAVILAQKNPYAKGREGGPAEWATVGEEGFEGIRVGDKMMLTPDKATTMWLPQGADVIPHDKMLRMLYQNPELSFAENVQSSIDSKKIVEGLGSVEKTIKNKKELNIIGSLEGGINYAVKNGNSITVYIQKNVAL